METTEENPERNGTWKRNSIKHFQVKLTNAEYRLLGKGLKFCPKPKHHDVLQLKQGIFEFTRKLRLKEFFTDKEHDDDDGGGGNNDKSGHNCYPFPKEKKIQLLSHLLDVTLL